MERLLLEARARRTRLEITARKSGFQKQVLKKIASGLLPVQTLPSDGHSWDFNILLEITTSISGDGVTTLKN